MSGGVFYAETDRLHSDSFVNHGRGIFIWRGTAAVSGKTDVHPPYSGTDPGRNRIQRRTSFEVFGKTANRVQEPYRSWMLDLQRRVEARGGQSFRGIWEVCTETKLKELHLKSRHMRELSEVGMYLGQMDVRTGRTSMQMYLENLGAEIEETRQEITAKRESETGSA